MKNFTILLVIFTMLAIPAFAQDNPMTLDPNQYVNTQIHADTLADGTQAHDAYLLERDTYYASDGRLDVDFKLVLLGPDNGPMVLDKDAGHPPVLVNTPDQSTGAARDFFQIMDGGELIVKNFIISGYVSTGEIAGRFFYSNGGERYEADNMVFSDWNNRTFRSYSQGIVVKITNSVFLNGGSGDYSLFDGMTNRFETSGDSLIVENNTLINNGRLICNAGPFPKMTCHVLHNTFVNNTKNAMEMRQFEFIAANNIWVNWEFMGFGPNQIREDDWYQMNWTTYNWLYEVSDKLDSISCYLGQNNFFTEEPINAWFAATTAEDSIHQSGLFTATTDTFVQADADFKIGTNYMDFNPQFTTPATDVAEVVAFLDAYWSDPQPAEAPSYDVPSIVTFPDGGAPVCHWPLEFDLSYSNEYLQTAGADGLPLGDLNWWPEKKADWLANRAQYVAALQDSILNATAIYTGDGNLPMITPATTAVEDDNKAPAAFKLAQNYPNPFNPTTSINYSLNKAEQVSLVVYNTIGQKVKTLVDTKQTAGEHTANWTGVDDYGTAMAGGVYFYQLTVGNQTECKKMVFLK